jgi:GTP-binding protein
MGKKMHGKGAVPRVVNVPIGTVVYRVEAPRVRRDEDEDENPSPEQNSDDDLQLGELQPTDLAPRTEAPPELVADLTQEGQEFVLCAGGKGGKGNVHFKSSRNRAPVQYTDGEEGEQGHFLFELRTIADAALVGYPNAGKSTLLGKVSAAHPKVAAYPFTTLRPSVGVVELDDYQRATIADIPGLIEGAHRNVGLGHDFLRHITRCRFLFFVVDIAGSEGRHPVEDLQSLRREIDLYDARLSQRPWCIVANKIDLLTDDENLEVVTQKFPRIKVIPISANRAEGIASIKDQLRHWLAESGSAMPPAVGESEPASAAAE